MLFSVPVFPQSVARTHFSEQAPFAVSPSLFNLQSGETVVVEVSVRFVYIVNRRLAAADWSLRVISMGILDFAGSFLPLGG